MMKLVSVLLFLTFLSSSQAIKCYVCSSLCDQDGNNVGDLEECADVSNACQITGQPDGQVLKSCWLSPGFTIGCSEVGATKTCWCDTDGCNKDFDTAGAGSLSVGLMAVVGSILLRSML
ncbi:uncharacterized protein LOC111716842 [Eurytemora carolleeae]|uniref:uncharacterized protein LOC111716842 n=1 Tax=Eurytemora carolleeae TaxID=1294199 RepID=UPI000C784886|nr:uncharacterized protein LOC111716842 [Eurytemora carolleeae]XP_023348107.1 uncharacterized protein LOC111716842 [Eurytemora carolleeae]XP_023348108.1 uncharacterized protein LOC111716842 [Eurytemora carolleeae]XP_023348109.1 uncharacterized protein LOC111716842 [Eurytemora carolleeae]|eukprot:XP_023348106.1 uncharacterized protein LOC111716842 [Eurytemora affinis]